MLKDLGIYKTVTAGKQCKACWAIDGRTWFTARHHRETPHRIEKGLADVGIVWTTEIKHAKAKGRMVDGVSIQAPYNMAHKVNYAIGSMKNGRNPDNAKFFLAYLRTREAQNIYAKYGFVRATREEMVLKPIL